MALQGVGLEAHHAVDRALETTHGQRTTSRQEKWRSVASDCCHPEVDCDHCSHRQLVSVVTNHLQPVDLRHDVVLVDQVGLEVVQRVTGHVEAPDGEEDAGGADAHHRHACMRGG